MRFLANYYNNYYLFVGNSDFRFKIIIELLPISLLMEFEHFEHSTTARNLNFDISLNFLSNQIQSSHTFALSLCGHLVHKMYFLNFAMNDGVPKTRLQSL